MRLCIAAWNMNHRVCAKPIPADVIPALLALAADVIVLTEFVPKNGTKRNQDRRPFYSALEQAGLKYEVSAEKEGYGRQNHVLVASRFGISKGDLTAEDAPDPALSNFLHVKLDAGVEVVGFRTPCWEGRGAFQIVEEYWSWLAGLCESCEARRIVFIGDMNVDPSRISRRIKPSIERIQRHFLWTGSDGNMGWSYWSPKGTAAIDHAFVSKSISLRGAQYVPNRGRFTFAGLGSNPLSDHAVLRLELEPKIVRR